MIASRTLAWALFAAWITWFFALQARLSAGSSAAPWVPDLGLVLSLSLLARLEEREAPVLALVLALSRSAFSSEPAVALLAGSLGLVLLALAARSVVELTGPLWRALITGGLVLAFDLWLALVQAARSPDAIGRLPVGAGALLAAALSSATLALVAGPALAHLPGLTPLRRRPW